MQISIIGTLIALLILTATLATRSSLLTALMISLVFGSTSFVTLKSIGGATPLIYTIFAALVVVFAGLRRNFWKDVGYLFGRSTAPWIVCSLLVYAAMSAFIFPRLFTGQTTIFVASHQTRGVFETPLEPVSGNISQTGYLILGGLVFLAIAIAYQNEGRLADIRRGYFAWAGINSLLGVVDIVGKLSGFGDLLFPIRTATYGLLTDIGQGDFWRITGGQSEASAFGAISLACLAFTFTYWKKTESWLAFFLSIILLVLLIFSTSSTAYVGLVIISIPLAFSILRSFLADRLTYSQLLVVIVAGSMLAALMLLVIARPDFFLPFQRLLNDMVFNKLSSNSGELRMYWNYKSLQSFLDTGGLGVGMGSSRASSWPIAVLSQLGLIGAAMFAVLLAILVLPTNRRHAAAGNPEDEAVISSVRASALASIVAATLIGGTADPGMIFFISLATVTAYNIRLKSTDRVSPDISHGTLQLK